jgi:tetratricopeptide (TPR) repeat protein
LVQEQPENPELQNKLATAYHAVGSFYRDNAKPGEAETALKEALASRTRLVQSHPGKSEYETALTRDHQALGQLYYQTSQLKEAESAFLKALEHQERVAATNPASPEAQRELASCCNGLGALYINAALEKDSKRIEDLLTKGLSIRETLARDHPRVSDYQSELARALNNLGLFYTFRERPKEAAELYNRSLRVRRDLAEKYPEVASHQVSVAKTYHDLGLLYKQSKDLAGAETAFREALSRQEQICRAHPQNTLYAVDRGITLMSLAQLAHEQGKPQLSFDWYEQALQGFRSVLRVEPNQQDAARFFRDCQRRKAWVLSPLGRHRESLAAWKELPKDSLSPTEKSELAQCVVRAIGW